MNKPLVSFIVPVYNAAPYLEQCLQSLVNQSVDEVEVIVVDDGSTDGSDAIYNSFVDRDPRVRVLNGARYGAGAARNRGLDVASGEYVVFIDADDWVDPDLASIVEKHRGFDIIYFGYMEHRHDRTTICNIVPAGDMSLDIDATAARLFRSAERFFGFTVNKAFRREIIENEHLRFYPDLIIKEDEDFCVRFINHVRTMYVSGATPYHYRILDGSLSHRPMRDRHLHILAHRIEEGAEASQWKELRKELIAAAHEYHLDAFRDSKGANFQEWCAFVARHRKELPQSLSRRLHAIPWKGLRAKALRLAYVNASVSRLKTLIKKMKP